MPSRICEQLNNLSHAQRERLAFIDFCLQYFGQVARADLIRHFNTGLASGTRDFNLYKKLACNNLILKHETKQYYRTADFKAIFQYDAETVLAHLSQGFGNGLAAEISSNSHCFDAIRLVPPKNEIIASLMRAIQQRQAIDCCYVSLSSGKSQRELVPHAIVNNGHRWHVRAFDRHSSQFRDFVCTRFTKITVLEQGIDHQESAASDLQWNNFLALQLIPHPKLSHPLAIELDYGMHEGVLNLSVREALLGYLMQQWHVDCSVEQSLNPRQYPLALANRELLSAVKNVTLLPGVC
ncbi:WYL domain-containing protein [Psychromonas sp.]|uniref:WYL domain-containing protein n=1 Tax=Psychromonas sp. TaxID=1884585 RepID=UPI003564D104